MKKSHVLSLLIAGYLYTGLLFLQNERVFLFDWWINLIIGLILVGEALYMFYYI